MATYWEGKYLTQVDNDAFRKDGPPGSAAPFAGVYRCMGCGREIGIASGHILPPQDHHTHTEAQGKIRWRLIVYADHNPKS